MNLKRILLIIGLVLLAGILAIQLLPFGRSPGNPPVVSEPDWDSPQTHELAQRACFDCHSNETAWPWYTSVAPVSWLVTRDVVEGREHLNFSNWQQSQAGEEGEAEEAEELGEVILSGEMPPPLYLMMHPTARLSEAEKEALARGLSSTAASMNAQSVNDGNTSLVEDAVADETDDDQGPGEYEGVEEMEGQDY